MVRILLAVAALVGAIAVIAVRAGSGSATGFSETGPVIDRELLGSFAPLPVRFEPEEEPAPAALIDLGRMLYFDPRLSRNHDVSCNSCHDLQRFGVDGARLSAGHRGQVGSRNSPTVYNAAALAAQFWDGRAETLEAQAEGPLLNPVEMAMTAERVARTLRSIPGYVEAFALAFPDEEAPISLGSVGRALAAFERGLVTRGRFDSLLEGDDLALTGVERRGLVRFVELGCATCHDGPALGGTSFQRLGLLEPYPGNGDLGRFALTGEDADRMRFRVPGLRNVAQTAPYLHDGSVETLDEMVRVMGRHQLGLTLSDRDAGSLVAFLEALTGEPPPDYIEAPALPASGPSTPPPEPT